MKTAIVAIAKNENLYIKDWIDYHLNLGFDDICIYDNNDIDGEKISDVIDTNIYQTVKIINAHGKLQYQKKAYSEWCTKYYKKYDWFIALDIDEYIWIESGISIKELLSKDIYKEYDSIKLCWQTIGDDDILEGDTSVPIYKRLFNVAKPLTQSKTINRGNIKCKFLSCHYPCIEINGKYSNNNRLNTCNSLGHDANDIFHQMPEFIDGGFYIKHFRTKTLKEFLNQKLNRTDASFEKHATIDYFWRTCNKSKEKETYYNRYIVKTQKNVLTVISSDCSAGFWFKNNNIQRNNPFLWCNIPIDDFEYLYDNFKNIDFTKYKIIKGVSSNLKFKNNHHVNVYNARKKLNELDKCAYIIIDDKIKVYYFHHIEGDNKLEKLRYDTDRYVDNIIEFLDNRYKKYLLNLLELQQKYDGNNILFVDSFNSNFEVPLQVINKNYIKIKVTPKWSTNIINKYILQNFENRLDKTI